MSVPTPARLRSVLGAAAAAATLALTGCGTATTGPAATTAEAPAVSVGQTVAVSGLADRVEAAVREAGSARVVLRADGTTATADVALDGDEPRMTATLGEGRRQVRARLLDGTLYLGGPQVARFVQGGSWLRVQEGGEDPVSRMLAARLTRLQAAAGDPAARLRELGATDATVVAVDGDRVTYRLEATRPDASPPRTATTDLTLDGAGRPVRLAARSGERSVVVTVDHWGEPVDVTAPSTDEVGTVDLSDLPDLG